MATVANMAAYLTLNNRGFVRGVMRSQRQWNRFSREVQRSAKTLPKSIQAALPPSLALARNMLKIAAGAGAAATGMIALFGRTAAQTQVTEVAMLAVARATGQMEQNVLSARDAIRAMGIAEQEANQITTRFLQSQLDLGAAAAVARVAQDAAVIAQQNSSQAAETMVEAIAGLNTRLLRQYGFTKNLNAIYADHARSLGINASNLTEVQQKQAILNYIMSEGARIAGTYERSMEAVGKKMGSLPRLWSDLANAIGEPLALPPMGAFVDALSEGLKMATRWAKENEETLARLGQAAATIVRAAGNVMLWFGQALTKITPVLVAFTGAIVGGVVPALTAWLIPTLLRTAKALWATVAPLGWWMAIGAAVGLAVWWLAKHTSSAMDAASKAWRFLAGAALYASSLVVRAVAAVINILAFIVPALRGAAQAVTSVADQLRGAATSMWQDARATSAVAEGAKNIADSAQGAAKAQEDLAEGIAEAGKAAAANLQSFDEVHTLQESMVSSMPQLDMPALDDMSLAGLTVPAGMASALEAVSDTVGSIGKGIREAWDSLIERSPAVRAAVEGIGKAVKWVRDNWEKIRPVVEAVAGAALIVLNPWLAIAAAVAGVAYLIATNWETVGPVFQRIWDIAKIALDGVYATFVAIWEGIKRFWGRWGEAILISVRATWDQFVRTVEMALKVVANIIGAVMAVIRGDWEGAWGHIRAIGEAIWDYIVESWHAAAQTTHELWGAIGRAIIGWWDEVKANAVETWTIISEWISGAWEGLLTKAADFWQKVKEGFRLAWEGIRDGVRDTWQGIANVVIGFLNRIIDAINDMIRQVNKIKFTAPDWVPVFGGKSWGFDLPTIKAIPTLAIGTDMVRSDGLAFLHRGERVVPADVAPGGFTGMDEDAIERAVYLGARDGMLAALAQGGSERQREGGVYFDGNLVGRILFPALEQEAQRRGLRLAVREV